MRYQIGNFFCNSLVAAGMLMGGALNLFAANYYVNDSLTNGDMYTSVVGSDAFSGTSSNQPKLTITNLLATYSLAPGDKLFIDTGLYGNYTMRLTNSGALGNPIIIQGATNVGKTIIRGGGGIAIQVEGSYLELRDITVTNASVGVLGQSGANVLARRIVALNSSYGFQNIWVTGWRYENCIAANNSTVGARSYYATQWDHCIFWNNNIALSHDTTSSTSISNSIFVGGTAFGSNIPQGDFNVFWGVTLSSAFSTLIDLQQSSGTFLNCVVADPLLLNPAGHDFHLRSVTGVYSNGIWTTNNTHSPAIDFGNPQSPAYTNEPTPNGMRVNAGFYGGTEEASKSRTNAWILALSFNDGGTIFGTGRLAWGYGAFTNNSKVRIQYSPDNGLSWSNIVTGYAVTNSEYTWVVTGFQSSVSARWRIMSEEAQPKSDTNDNTFVVRASAQGFVFYVNDDNTNGDIYCSSPGNNANSGVASNLPKADLPALFNAYGIGPGDRIYVDTGLYTNTVTISARKGGSALAPLDIIGSTNQLFGGTIIERRNTSDDALQLAGAGYVNIKNMVLRRARYGINCYYANNSFARYNTFENMDIYSNQTAGVYLSQSPSNRFVNCSLTRNTLGFHIAGSAAQSRGNAWEQGVLYANNSAFNLIGADTLTVSNSVISGGIAFSDAVPPGDYNVVWNATLKTGYATLSSIQKGFDSWWWSLYADPQFHDANGLDFHPQSTMGRYNPATRMYVTSDTNLSVLIDFGAPASLLFTNEPAPNGSRMNIGRWGGTGQASKSRTNAWLQVLSLNDGGILEAASDMLRWNAGGYLPGATVRIEFSRDSAASWDVITGGVLAAANQYAWSNTNFASSPYARWRIVLESNTNILSMTQSDFMYRNGPFVYYLNDSFTNGDVYTKAIGNNANLGISAYTPKRDFHQLLNDVDLEPGDNIYVDTGLYATFVPITFTSLDCGTNNSPVTIQGSTNHLAGGSLFYAAGAIPVFQLLSGASDLHFYDFNLQNSHYGVDASDSYRLLFDRINMQNIALAAFSFSGCSNVNLRACVARRSGRGIQVTSGHQIHVENSVFWRMTNVGVQVNSGWLAMSNNVVVAEDGISYCYYSATPSNLVGNYNVVWPRGNAVAGYVASTRRVHDTLAAWRCATTQELFSLSCDPQFYDPDNGDFHLKTEVPRGRRLPDGSFASDLETSPLINAGSPAAPYSMEPVPNGNRVDIGSFGNTPDASIGFTNAWLHAATGEDGGSLWGGASLHWVAGGGAVTQSVRVDYSLNGGGTWTVLASGLAATSELCNFNTLLVSNSPAALWRVSSLEQTNVAAQITNLLAIRNGSLSIYVNDNARTNDVFTTAIGSPTNWLASASQPLDSLMTVFSRMDLEPGDAVWVDTGAYTNTSTLRITRRASGSTGMPVRVIGNYLNPHGGSVVLANVPASASGVQFDGASWLSYSNVAIEGGFRSLFITNSANLDISLRAAYAVSNGVLLMNASNIVFRQCVLHDTAIGFEAVQHRNISLRQSLVWSNRFCAVQSLNGQLSVQQSILEARGLGNTIYYLPALGGSVTSVYNNLLTHELAGIGIVMGQGLRYLSDWISASGNDRYSLSHDPLFADPASRDYHLKSLGGRYLASGVWVTDVVHSALIDGGDPAAAYAVEPAPNGLRVNLGLYGNTAQASRTPTNGWLTAISFNDGGFVRASNSLYWTAGGSATGHTVKIEFSPDGGLSWTQIVSGISAAQGFVAWDTTNYLSTAAGLWRIISLQDPRVVDTNDNFFAVKNEPLGYYVNDPYTNGDVYCSGPGSSLNTGLKPSVPKSSLQDMLNTYPFEPGDVIYIDTGRYPLTNSVEITMQASGTNRIVLQGSTNYAAGGALFMATNRVAFTLEACSKVGLRDLRIGPALEGVRLLASSNCVLEKVAFEACGTCLYVRDSDGTRASACRAFNYITNGLLMAEKAGAVTWEQGTMVSAGWVSTNDALLTTSCCFRVQSGTLWASNNIVRSLGALDAVFYVASDAGYYGDFNNFYQPAGALLGRLVSSEKVGPSEQWLDTLAEWQRVTGQDTFSTCLDPGFADATNYLCLLSSQEGRRDPYTWAWITDAVSSPLIDAADPLADYSHEPEPNGQRLNSGAYGNTPDASKTPTNSMLQPITFNDGGIASGTNVLLRWLARGNATNQLVRLLFSTNAGLHWMVLASNQPASARQYLWDITNVPNVARAAWAIASQVETAIIGRTERPFTVRNTPFTFYVNDDSTVGDVYSSAIGKSTNHGLAPDNPMFSLQDVLRTYNLEAGDTVFVDTGIYAARTNTSLTPVDCGDATQSVFIVGSTNYTFGGSSFVSNGIVLVQANGISLAHLRILAPPGAGLEALNSGNMQMAHLEAADGMNGILLSRTRNATITHCTLRNSMTNGLLVDDSDSVYCEHSVFWSNRQGVAISSVNAPAFVSISNSLIGAWGSMAVAYRNRGNISADYNAIIIEEGAAIANVLGRPLETLVFSLVNWFAESGCDAHSVRAAPLLANPQAGDFHLQSSAGRYCPTNRQWMSDVLTSPLIDAGAPAHAYALEPAPNGNRVNIGLYGNTGEASKSPTNSRLTLLTLYDGGRVQGTNYWLRWTAQGNATAGTSRIRFSSDAGSNWITLATGLPNGIGAFSWDTTLQANTIRGLLEITSEQEPNIVVVSVSAFAIRNGPLQFYVNDTLTNGDVYCTAPGNQANDGLTPAAPLLAIQSVLDLYDLDEGDTVYVDTGEYIGSATIIIGQYDSANATNVARVIFQGSTNLAAGGTILDRSGGAYGFHLYQAAGAELRHFRIKGATTAGVYIEDCYDCVLRWVDVQGGADGFIAAKGEHIVLEHCSQRAALNAGLYINNCRPVSFYHGVLWSNGAYGVYLAPGARLAITNSIIGLDGSARYAYYNNGGVLLSDYNAFFLTNNAWMGFALNPVPGARRNYYYPSLSLWNRNTTQDFHSLSANLLFADPSGGDYHLLSTAGRYVTTNAGWVSDALSSDLIDVGAPSTAWTNEPVPNGARLNIGLYGGMREASKTATNAAFTLLSLNDGGRVEGLKQLHWVAHGTATGHQVRVEYSTDAGANWHTIVSGVPASDGQTLWNTTATESTMLGLWRIVSLNDPAILRASSSLFAIRNQRLNFYVNDEYTNGDVYCQSPGNDEQYGVSPAAPKASWMNLLETWDLEPGDTVYIDTGSYLLGAPVVISQFDAGQPTNVASLRVSFIGSTNEAAGGTLFQVFGDNLAVHVNNAPGISLKHMRFRGASTAVRIEESEYTTCQWLAADQGKIGFQVLSAPGVSFANCRAANNAYEGLSVDGVGQSVVWEAGNLWSNQYAVWQKGGALTVHNSIIGASGNGKYAYFIADPLSMITSEYNNIYLERGAFAAAMLNRSGTYTSEYESVAKWYEVRGHDKYTLTYTPGFADLSAGDYHLRSTKGRYSIKHGWTNDARASQLIDGGDPISAYTNEPDPNGGRINLGMYAGTEQASMTPTQGWYNIISLNDGGSVAGNIELRWYAGWIATGHLVRLDYSPDNGKTWTNIVQHHPASTLSYWWDSVDYGRSALGRWRITSEVNPGINCTNDYRFSLRNGGTIPYYVNDPYTNGDVYCKGPGSSLYDGLTPETPLDSVQTVLDLYDLDPVDYIYVDAGNYEVYTPISIYNLDGGEGTNRVILQGSTNPVAPAVFDGKVVNFPVLRMANLRGFDLRDITLQGGSYGLQLGNVEDCEILRVRVQNNKSGGIDLSDAAGITFRQCLVWNNRGSVPGWGIQSFDSEYKVLSSVVWGNYGCIYPSGNNTGFLDISNSVLHADGEFGRIYLIEALLAPSRIRANFNNYQTENGAMLCEWQKLIGGSDFYPSLFSWSAISGSDSNSMAMTPMFADLADGDFHPRSMVGRYFPGVGWTNDNDHSPLIDLGDPVSAYDLEPTPNGNRLNIGLYGNTTQASKSRTNRWLYALTLNDGGIISGTNLLKWATGNMLTGDTVRLEYSLDGGVSWATINSNLAHGLTAYDWDVSQLPATALALWRILSEVNTNIYDTCDQMFAIKNYRLALYCNDDSTNGDQYCTTIGKSDNSGTNAASPLNNPAELVRKYPVGAGDVIFIDTGNYVLPDTNSILLNMFNRGESAAPLLVYGSSNEMAGGSSIYCGTNTVGLTLRDTRFTRIYNLKFSGGRAGVVVNNSYDCHFENIQAFTNQYNGFDIQNAARISLDRCTLWNNGGYGLSAQMNAQGFGSVNRSILWGNRAGALYFPGTELVVSNSILHSGQPDTPIVLAIDNAGVYRGDYNAYWYENGGILATDVYLQTRINYISQWQSIKNADQHSAILNPWLVNPSNGLFSLRSQAGYYNPATGSFLTSTNTSWAIDAAGPGESFSQEPWPNGNRMNLGVHGNSAMASKSWTNVRELLTVTFNDGGTMTGDQLLYWMSRGLSATNRLRIDYSPDNGTHWIMVTSGLSVAQHGYVWADTNPPSPVARWRITLEADPTVQCLNATSFVKRTGPIYYYVNDASTNGDIYTSAIGNPTNVGYYSNAPKSRVSDILASYELGPRDVIYVDTGAYTVKTAIGFGYLSKGSELQRLEIIGSTNSTHGGTVFDAANSGQPIFQMVQCPGLMFKNLRLRRAHSAFAIDQLSSHQTIKNCVISDCSGPGVDAVGNSYNVFLDHTVIANGKVDGLHMAGSSVMMDGCVIWSNKRHAVLMEGAAFAFFSNSVFSSWELTNACYAVSTNDSINSDYNLFYTANGSRPVIYANAEVEGLLQWSTIFTQDIHSLWGDPSFNSPGALDFHPRSAQGRYDPGLGRYTSNDVGYSVLLDTGATNSDYYLETHPNGGRRNVGLFGHSGESSLSRTSQWVLAITAMNGGRGEGLFYLVWAYGNIHPTNMAILDYSFDNGNSWKEIARVPVGKNEYLWMSDTKIGGEEVWASSPIARWRITLDGRTNITDMTDTHFALRNKLFKYYVNDAFTNGDVYTTAPGNDTNLGFYPDAPKASLRSLLDSADLEGEDSVWIDTGSYPINETNQIVIGRSDEGDWGKPVEIFGNTNAPVSVFYAVPPLGQPMVDVVASYINWCGLTFVGSEFSTAGSGPVLADLVFSNCPVRVEGDWARLERLAARSSNLRLQGSYGSVKETMLMHGNMNVVGNNNLIQNCAVYVTNDYGVSVFGNSITFINNTVVSHATALRKGGGPVSLYNNILVAQGKHHSVLEWSEGNLNSDYNNLVARDGAWVGNYEGKWENLLYWQQASGRDQFSIAIEPRFVDEAGGDLHLRSTMGHYTPTGWVADATFSPCIDLGNPASMAYTNEPMPNGSRVNLGAYGGTAQASKSASNVWLLAMTLNDGGVARGTNFVLRWRAGNAGPADTVRLDYSTNNGVSWISIASGINALDEQYEWDTTLLPDSLFTRWRVVSEIVGSIADTNDTSFALRNVPRAFFVNDASTNGDVYCTAIGSPANDGLTPATPRRVLQDVLDAYDLEPLDVIKVDTGVYGLTQDTVIVWSRSGSSVMGPTQIQGSTNYGAGGSVFVRSNTLALTAASAFDVKASFIDLADLHARMAYRGFFIDSNQNVSVRMASSQGNQYGYYAFGARNARLNNSRIWSNMSGGVYLSNTRTTSVENCVLYMNEPTAVRLVNTAADSMQNNILTCSGPSNTAYVADWSALGYAFVDYNVYHLLNNAAILVTPSYGTYRDLRLWQLDSAKDFRSYIGDPLYANPNAGDFHLRSQAGRYQDGVGWVNDSSTSWAIDKGSPQSAYSNEPPVNGARINLGAYGNTPFASKGTTNAYLEARVLNSYQFITVTNSRWPLVWTALNVPTSSVVRVQYSGDGGKSWVDLATGLSAYQEYYVWQTIPYYNTFKGLWRVIDMNNTNYMDMNDTQFQIFYGEFAISRIFRSDERYNNIIWRGAWDEQYRVEYSTDMINWYTAPASEGPNRSNNFVYGFGGDMTYEDIDSQIQPRRMYRVRRVIGEITIYLRYVYRISNMCTLVWESLTPASFTVQYSTNNMATWTTAASGVATNQKSQFAAPDQGIFQYQDIESSNSLRRLYRILGQ